jgi:hypothetical protein
MFVYEISRDELGRWFGINPALAETNFALWPPYTMSVSTIPVKPRVILCWPLNRSVTLLLIF